MGNGSTSVSAPHGWRRHGPKTSIRGRSVGFELAQETAARHGTTFAIACGGVLAAWIITLLTRDPFSGTSADLVFWIVVLCAVSVLPIAGLPAQARGWSELGILYAVVWALTFGVASLAWLNTPIITNTHLILHRADVVRAIALLSAGIACFWAGYLLVRRTAARATSLTKTAVRWHVIVIAYVVGMAAKLYLMKIGLYGYSLSYSVPGGYDAVRGALTVPLLLIAISADVATLSAFAWILATKARKGRILVSVFAAGLIIVGLVSGGKSILLGVPFEMALVYIAFRKRIPKSIIMVAVLLFLLVLPGSELFRRTVDRSSQQGLTGSVQTDAIAEGLDLSASEQWRILTRWLKTRPQSADQVAAIITQTPNVYPYRGGDLWALAPVYNVIPRAVWPNKPDLGLQYDFDHTYMRVPPEIPGNTGVTQPGDMYVNFGLSGLLVGMFVWGLVLATMTKRWRMIQRPDRLVVFALSAPYVLLPDRSFTDMLLVLPRYVLVALVVVSLIFVRTPRTEASYATRDSPPLARREVRG